MYGIDSEQMFSNASSRFDAMFGGEEDNGYGIYYFIVEYPNGTKLKDSYEGEYEDVVEYIDEYYGWDEDDNELEYDFEIYDFCS